MRKWWAWPLFCLAAYTACLIFLLPRLPFSVDEILDLIPLRIHGWRELMAHLGANAGGTPLSYLVRLPLVDRFGELKTAARFPSALSSVAACFGVFLLARRLGLRWPLLAALVFATFPLQLRYALEARAYSQALCLSVWATVLFLRWTDRERSFPRALLYGLTVVAAIFTQPYALFVAVAHFLWLGIQRRWRMSLAAGAVILAAGAAFVPWYAFSVPLWKQDVLRKYPQSTIGLPAAGLILREIAGTGYFGSGLMIVALTIAFRFGFQRNKEMRSLWALYLVIPLIGVLAADRVFVYFLAIRQMIFVLAPLAVLFTLGVETAWTRGRRFGAVLAVALLAASTFEDAHMFYRPLDDYDAGAAMLAAEPGCIIFVPQASRAYYLFFRAELASRDCNLETAGSVAVMVSLWGRGTDGPVDQMLRGAGFARRSERKLNGPVLQLYAR